MFPGWTDLRRGALLNEETGDLREFLINPEELKTQVDVTWNRQAALGASGERLSYGHTAAAKFDLTLRYHRMEFVERYRPNDRAGYRSDPGKLKQAAIEFENHRRFLLSLCYPRGRTTDILRRSPPMCLLIWPNYLAVRVVVLNLSITDRAFAIDGAPVAFEAALSMLEYRTYRLTSVDVFGGGLLKVVRQRSATP